MGDTYESKASVKNGVNRMIFVVLSILLEVLVILGLLFFTGMKAGWIYHLIRLVALVLVLRIYGSYRTASIRMTWIIVILLLPITGTTLYALIGLNGHSLKMRKRYEDIDRVLFPLLPKNEEVAERARRRNKHLGGIVNYIRKQAGYPVYENTKVTYYDDAEKGFEAQKAELAKARKFIFMEYHAIEDAECWHEIRDVLVDRVKAGVEVRVFYDDMGSLGFINTDFVTRTQELGIKCRVFNPFVPGLNLFLNNRDHRKITVIDGVVGFTGGYNLANEYFHRTEPFGFWKDTGLKLEGDAVQSLTITFLEMWNAISEGDKDDDTFKQYLVSDDVRVWARTQSGQLESVENKLLGKAGADKLRGNKIRDLIRKEEQQLSESAAKHSEKVEEELKGETAFATENAAPAQAEAQSAAERGEAARGDAVAQAKAQGDAEREDAAAQAQAAPEEAGKSRFGFVQPYADSPMDLVHVGEDVYMMMVEGAHDYCWFVTPYLIITDEMCSALSLAARRGVDVRIVTPGIPDKKIVYSMTRSYYNGLTRNGVRIFEYTPGFCHAKMSIADDVMATCGTINMDYRSLYHHFENGCLYADCEAVAQTKRDFEEMFRVSNEVTEYYTSGQGAFQRFGQMLLRLGAPLM